MLLDRYLEHRAEREIDTELYRRVATATLAEVKALIAAGAMPKADGAALDRTRMGMADGTDNDGTRMIKAT